MKTTMKLSDIIEAPHYNNIISLTIHFQNKENGLRFIHYRWALIKNHDGIDSKGYFGREMNKFFSSTWNEKQKEEIIKESKGRFTKKDLDKKNLNYYLKFGLIKKDCIQGKYAKNNLSNFLDNLVTKYKVLQKHKDNDGIDRYTIVNFKRIVALYNRWEIKRWVETWSDDNIFKLYFAGCKIEDPDIPFFVE